MSVILPSFISSNLFNLDVSLKFGNTPWYRHVCAVGAGLNILMMMAANLVGFVIGTDGLRFFVQQLFGTSEGLSHF